MTASQPKDRSEREGNAMTYRQDLTKSMMLGRDALGYLTESLHGSRLAITESSPTRGDRL